MIIIRKSLISKVNSELVSYICSKIIPEYKKFDRAHGEDHVLEVIEKSLVYAKYYDVNIDMVFVVSSYHDLGLKYGRDNHEINSGKILRGDKKLKEWFTQEQINIMAEAIEDHRASLEYEPRTIYGKIISEADRVIDPERTIERTIKFSLDNYPNLSKEQHLDRVYNYLLKKYSKNGYVKLWLPESDNRIRLRRLQKILSNKEEFSKIFYNIYNICSKS